MDISRFATENSRLNGRPRNKAKVEPKDPGYILRSRSLHQSPSPFWRRTRRAWLLLGIHLVILCIAYIVAYVARYEFRLPADKIQQMYRTLPWVLVLKLIVFYAFGSFRARWRFVSISDLTLLLEATVASSLIVAAIDYSFNPIDRISVAVLLLDWGVTVILLGGVQSASRIVREHLLPAVSASAKKRVLIIGADAGGDALARQMNSRPDLDYRVVGFLDSDESIHGSRLGRVRFLGSPDNAVAIAQRNDVRKIFVFTGTLNGPRLRSLLNSCRDAEIEVKMIPPVDRLLDDEYHLEIRDVDVNDLLGRMPIRLDTDVIAEMLADRTVMVTGAGGSIGSEICRQIAHHRPKRLILIERAENNLFHIERALKSDFEDVSCHACLADVCDADRMRVLFARYQPAVVFHAAAHKHVPLMESNGGEAVKNNVFGTKTVADISAASGVDRFILISTDKAVNPTSIMGLSKRFAERYIYFMQTKSKTKFVAVRFGNVLGSNGSVVPIFQEQIRHGGPVTVTHPDMRRFFMTIPEASQLVLQAAAIGGGGEVFVLDMGDPVKIVELAKDLIRVSGFADGEIEMEFVGVRPGEKIYEEIYDADERSSPTSHSKLRVVLPRPVDPAEVTRCIAELAPILNASEESIFIKLRELLINDLGPKGRLCGRFAQGGNTVAAAGGSPKPDDSAAPVGSRVNGRRHAQVAKRMPGP